MIAVLVEPQNNYFSHEKSGSMVVHNYTGTMGLFIHLSLFHISILKFSETWFVKLEHNTSSVCLCHQTIPFDRLAIINDCIIGWLRLTSLINNYTTATYTESHPNNRCIWSISCGLFYGIVHRSLKWIIIVRSRIIFISHRPLIIRCLQTQYCGGTR